MPTRCRPAVARVILFGRVIADDLRHAATHEVAAPAGTLIDETWACETPYGLRAACYGRDPGPRLQATWMKRSPSSPPGSSVSPEPQLSMRAFHIRGAAAFLDAAVSSIEADPKGTMSREPSTSAEATVVLPLVSEPRAERT